MMQDGTATSVQDLADAGKVARHEVIAHVLKEAQPYIEALRGKTLVIKLGGSTLAGSTPPMGGSATGGLHQRDALEDIVWLRGLGARPVLVHGGGPEINEWLGRLGIPARFERGLRVTDAATLDVVRMVLVGRVNGELVCLIGRVGGRAVGLSGLDGALLVGRQVAPELGYVGTVTTVNPGPIEALGAAGYIPVIAPLALSEESGDILNVNADDAAADLALGLGAAKLLYLTDTPGILDREGRLLSELTDAQVRALIADGTIYGGMIPKAEACLRALAGSKPPVGDPAIGGVATPRVHIVDGREPHVLLRELLTHEGAGTMIQREQQI